MKFVVALIVLVCVATACAERNVPQRGYAAAAANQPYFFLGGPRTRANHIQAIQMPMSAAELTENDDEDDDDQDDSMAMNDSEDDEHSFDDDTDDIEKDDEDDQEMGFNGNNIIGLVPLSGGSNAGRNYLRSMLARNGGNAGSLMVPEGFMEIEAQGIFDEETGETAIFLPRNALAGIPEGSVVALVEDTESMGKANKVIVTRRRKGPKRGKKRDNRRRRRGGNKRRPNKVRVIRRKPIRRGGNKRGNRQRRPSNVIRI